MPGSFLRDNVRRVYNAGFDLAYGISSGETSKLRDRPHSLLADEIRYVPIDYLALLYLIAPIRFRPHDVFVDIGCGLGRALLTVARRPIRRAIGIEYNPQLADVARENAGRLRGRRTMVEVVNLDAALADYTCGTIFWMYNPFGKATMSVVPERLRQSLLDVPRRATIAYANPELAPLLDNQAWLRRSGDRRFPGAGENGRAIYWQAG